MAKKASPNYTGFRPSKRVDTADFERIRLAFRAPLNSQRSLKEDPAKVLERLLDERVPVDGKKKTKGEVIVGNLIALAGGDRAASKLLDGFLARQRDLRFQENYAALFVSDEVLQHVEEKLRGK